MIRRIAREIVLQSLFQIDFTKCEPAFALETAVEFQTEGDEEKTVVEVHKEEELAKAKEYAETLLNGITKAILKLLIPALASMLLTGPLKECLQPTETFCVLRLMKCCLQRKSLLPALLLTKQLKLPSCTVLTSLLVSSTVF